MLGHARPAAADGPGPQGSTPRSERRNGNDSPGAAIRVTDQGGLTALDIARKASLCFPITSVAREIGISEDLLLPYGQFVAKLKLGTIERAGRSTQSPLCRGDGRDSHAPGRGEDHHHPGPGPGDAPCGSTGHRGHPPGVHGTDLRDQGRGRRGRLQPGGPVRGAQPAPHRGHARGHRRPQHPVGHGRQPPLPGQRARALDPSSITWRRVLDVNDRALRNIVTRPGHP